MKRCQFILVMLLLPAAGFAQGPVFHQSDLWSFAYEDVSDLLRRYPGMYSLDYGTLGAPLVFRPWQLNPWLMEVERDGIPQNRRYDGLFDANLQPAAEMDTIRYDFLAGDGAGRFDLATRKLPTDTPYTEFQIREGFYGYGTIDLAHGQQIYRSLTAEVTGRMVWFNGRNMYGVPSTYGLARTYRLRGRIGYNLNRAWRAELSYGGANDDTQLLYASTVLVDSTERRLRTTYYTEREEGLLHIHRSDSARTAFDPGLKLFMRQDRENWTGPFGAREQVYGAIADAFVPLPSQRLHLRAMSTYTDMDFPGLRNGREAAAEFQVADSLGFRLATLNAFGGVRYENGKVLGSEAETYALKNGGFRAETIPVKHFALHGGMQYTEQSVPLAWRHGRYKLRERPLLISPEFAVLQFGDLDAEYIGDFLGVFTESDRYLKSYLGLRWKRGMTLIDAQLMSIQQPGDEVYRFVRNVEQVYLAYDESDEASQVGIATQAVFPLKWGLRVDSWWFSQASSETPGSAIDTRGYSRLYWERDFFTAPLTVRAHVSYEHYGTRQAYSDLGTLSYPPADLLGFRMSATIKGVTLVWGSENLLPAHYSILPGYPMIGKEEYLAFIWRLWL